MNVQPVTIVGAGPTGLTAALVLARSGTSARVLAKDPGPTTESRALVVQPRVLELWHRLGIADRAVAEGHPLRYGHAMVAGRPLRRPLLDVRAGGAGRSPYEQPLVLEQSRTERLLLDALEQAGGTVDWQAEVVGLRQDPDGVELTVRHRRGEETVRRDWVVGADGASSAVRKLLGLPFVGGTYEQQFFLADVDMTWAYGRERFWLDLVDHGIFGFFPMEGDDHYRVIGSVTPELATAAAERPLTRTDIEDAVRAYGHLDVDISTVRWATVYRLHHRRAERFRVGRVFLAGDAAHIHSPAGGQGMNLGVGDGYNLAWKLAAVVRGRAPEALLDSYETERLPVAETVLRGTDRGFLIQSSPHRAVSLLRKRLFPLLNALLPGAQRLLYSLISQLWISYRSSPVSVDAGPRSRVRAGDRLPYTSRRGDAAEADLYAALTGVGWHLLVLPAGPADDADARAGDRLVAAARAWAADRADVEVVVVPPAATRTRADLGVRRGDGLLLVRPDGHLAVRSQTADVAVLDETPALTPRPAATVTPLVS